jgi:NAD-specific glutamate dehydrogenase
VVDETVIEIFTSKMGITSSGLDLENTLFNSEERHIESSSSKIEDEDISLADDLFVESVSDSSSGGFVDDTEDVHARDGSSILGRLTLRVAEVRRVATSSGGGS